MFTAHIRGNQIRQTCKEHSLNTARYASEALSCVGLASSGFTAGILHDCGKFSEKFETYISQAAAGQPVKRGSVIHTFAAVRYLLKTYHSSNDKTGWAAAELLAWAAGAHHGQFDFIDENGQSGFDKRIDTDAAHSDEAIRNFFAECIPERELAGWIQKSRAEISSCMLRCRDLTAQAEPSNQLCEFRFYLSLLSRLLLSAVIEGDRRDTAEFMDQIRFPDYGDPAVLWTERLAHIEARLAEFRNDTPIAVARSDISHICRAFASRGTGIYRLNVPTGGGKTLSGLRFAVAHAKLHEKKRIIFTAPLLSILDQNAAVIRNFVGDDSIILEHHSNVVNEPTDDGTAELDERELLCESWDAPIIITTLVQLLNTLFEGRTSSIRRFHSLCNAVIVIDEVQTVPTNMLSLFNLACNFLAYVCNSTVVLCSATQPCLESTTHPLILSKDCDIVPYDDKLWAVFNRTKIEYAGDKRLEEIPDFAVKLLAETDSLLIVCNKKDQAESLWLQIKERVSRCHHLSASMCMAHRKEVLREVKNDLADGVKTVLVSTQVIEAGVDISFGCVIRLCAGMDSIVQSAGRCNRNGESAAAAPVYIVKCMDENLSRLTGINDAKTATIALLADYAKDSCKYDDDLSSDPAIRYYYSRLYQNMPRGHQDYTVMDNPSYFELATKNTQYVKLYEGMTDRYVLWPALKKAGRLFEVFDNNTYDVIVPFGDEGRAIIAELCSEALREKAGYQPGILYELIRKARPYTVSLYKYQYDQLEKAGCLLTDVTGSVCILAEGMYDDHTGVITDTAKRGYTACSTTIL